MATIHIRDIQQILRSRGEGEAVPWGEDGFFLEIRFDEQGQSPRAVDREYSNKALSVDAPQGSVTITFDEWGQLKSLDIS
jgi:hypothetical protein